MIFVMIASSYTPFALNALSPEVGRPLCAVVWGLAALGIALKLGRPHRYEMLSLALYLSLGWLGVGILPRLLAVLPSEVLLLLLSGGILYSLGSFVHTHARMPFPHAPPRNSAFRFALLVPAPARSPAARLSPYRFFAKSSWRSTWRDVAGVASAI